MTPGIRPLIAGNWKMNGLKASVRELGQMIDGYDPELRGRVELMVCPPATLLSTFAVVALGSRIAIGAQDCHARPSGAHTGDISAEMIADTGATAVIVGHSERRQDHGETDEAVRAKAEAARRAGLVAVICVGETEAERRADKTLDRIGDQLDGSVPDGSLAAGLVIAYEPVWAIGTGLTPTPADVAEVHAFIRERLSTRFPGEGCRMRILYGGSVKPANAADLLAVRHVDGALVGGASLKAADFLAIAEALRTLEP
ncbi:triosephosphate isomerase [Tepidamorphus gemmatus]|jgi:triosephosphate isomerase|uniref:Triosephosphate isomerase n=1 Tax=Tepidamorphus gemmatus TaxID=747076 RepID=A0A4R3MFE7_9HYPH|nr:triose-phosphate isomerase [Tepidamorphus gemmatus]TCT12569.1 triosephosphate isomerase [Tepidamorphus gemmatus]